MWDNVLENIKGFLTNRIAFWDNVVAAKTPHERWTAMLKLIQPVLPKQYRHFGQFDYFPQKLHKSEYMVIICNHQSDLDGFIATGLLHTEFIERKVKCLGITSMSGASSPSQEELTNVSQSIRPVGFTLSHFSQIPGLGKVLTETAILVQSGITDEELECRINERLEEGYNTFILFPEGGIHSFERDLKSREYWNGKWTEQKKYRHEQPYPFQNVFMPRFKSWEILLKILKHRLRYVVDLTVLYPNYKPWTKSWNYDTYPSVTYSLAKPLQDPVFTHTKIYDLKAIAQDQKKSMAEICQYFAQEQSLLDLWVKKEKRMEWLRQREIEYKNEENEIG